VDAEGCEAVVVVVLEAMEEGVMEHHEAVDSEVAFGVDVAAEAMRPTDAYDHQVRPLKDQDWVKV
jgi:hypothetical protein